MKGGLYAVLFLLFVTIVPAAGRASVIVIGTADNGSCYPFTCNDSGTSTGQSLQYEQVYSSSSFPGTVNITSESFYYMFARRFLGSSLIIGGTYEGFLSITPAAVDNLSSTSVASNVGSGQTEVFDFTVPAGGELIPSDGIFTVNDGISGFTYNPATGNLLLDVIVMNQDNAPNIFGKTSYLDTDDTGAVTSEAFAFDGSNAGYAQPDGVVTGFAVTLPMTTTVPEPRSLLLIATGLFLVAALLLARRKDWPVNRQ